MVPGYLDYLSILKYFFYILLRNLDTKLFIGLTFFSSFSLITSTVRKDLQDPAHLPLCFRQETL